MAGTLLTPTHMAIVLVVLLLLFGANRLPHAGRALGKGLREFRDGLAGRDGEKAADISADQQEPKRPPEVGP